MVAWWEAVLLGVVQGATEYLPVSSSGHLVIAQWLVGLREPVLFFDVALHVATLLAVVVYYRRDLAVLARDLVGGGRELAGGRGWTAVQEERPGFRLAWLIAVGTLPTAVLGLAFEDTFEALFGSVQAVGAMLLVTAGVLALTRWARPPSRDLQQMGIVDALLVGTAQGLAITPGISRSGATIAVALLLGVERETAARYSFLLAVPSILGALLLELAKGDPGQVAEGPLAAGFVAAAVTGYACLAALVWLVKRGRLAWFTPYCLAVGLAALVFGG
jgi:undecaprenyl-diphosphatase